ncbi:MAG: hypothetical protein RL885_02265 [Planctomycetota bacterium]
MGVPLRAVGLFFLLAIALVSERSTSIGKPGAGLPAPTSNDDDFLSAADRAAWVKLLEARLLDPADLVRTGFEPRRPLGLALRATPMDIPVRLGEWAEQVVDEDPEDRIRRLWDSAEPVSWIVESSRSLDDIFERHASEEARFARREGLVPKELEEPLRLMLDAILDARGVLDLVLNDARIEEWIRLRALLERHIGLTTEGLSEPDVLSARLSELDLEPFVLALERLTRGARAASAALADAAPPDVIEDGMSLALRFDFGDVILGGFGNDVHDWPAIGVLEPGGNDIYRLPVASADGSAGRSTALLVDANGDDWYMGQGPVSQGAAVLGASVLWDGDGSDRYEGGDVSQGASLLGAALAADLGVGRDIWVGGRFSQASAVFGLSILIGDAGDDTYSAGDYSQASAIGGAALLIDHEGADHYEVRMPPGGSGLSWSQAAATTDGLGRFESIAALLDDAGDDVYHSPAGAQALADSTGIALLRDLSGDDEYSVRQIGQARASGHAVALLLDVSGRDRYLGGDQCQAVAQTGSIALLVDRLGADLYLAGDVSQAAGSNGGLAALIDSGGADRYLVPKSSRAQPWSDPERGAWTFLIDSGGERDSWSGLLSAEDFHWTEAGATGWDVDRKE